MGRAGFGPKICSAMIGPNWPVVLLSTSGLVSYRASGFWTGPRVSLDKKKVEGRQPCLRVQRWGDGSKVDGITRADDREDGMMQGGSEYEMK